MYRQGSVDLVACLYLNSFSPRLLSNTPLCGTHSSRHLILLKDVPDTSSAVMYDYGSVRSQTAGELFLSR